MELVPIPDNVLQRLICQECFRYLTVPPITNISGEIICGRCFDPNDSGFENKHTKSFYNIIAEGYSFKCINRYNNRCSQVMGLGEAKDHEQICSVLRQECPFCSFSGVLSQILYHSLKVHPDNVTYDGKLYFSLNNMTFQKKSMFISGEDIFLIAIGATDELLTIEVSAIVQTLLPIGNQFGVKFFIPEDPLNVNYLHTDYGWLNVNLANYFEKSKDELITLFGTGIKVCCQILVGQFSLERELEFKQKFLNLSQHKEELNNLQQELEIKKRGFLEQTNVWEQTLAKKDQLYDSAANIIKKMSLNFKCFSCQKIALDEIYYCPKNHFYCITCLRNICKGCDTVQEFKTLNDMGNFEVSCDWSGCKEIMCLKNYLEHKRSCVNRPYSCHLKECYEEVIYLSDLSKHFHNDHYPSLTIIQESSISCNMNQSIDCYWIINGDLYHVIMRLGNIIRVLIEEFDVIPNNVLFKCEGRNAQGQNINFSHICGNYDMNIANINSYYNNIEISFT